MEYKADKLNNCLAPSVLLLALLCRRFELKGDDQGIKGVIANPVLFKLEQFKKRPKRLTNQQIQHVQTMHICWYFYFLTRPTRIINEIVQKPINKA
eukprot:2226097-Amphidinium_carterae.1